MEPQTMTERLQHLDSALQHNSATEILSIASESQPREREEMLLSLDPAQLTNLFRLIGFEKAGDLLEGLSTIDAAQLLVRISGEQAGSILEHMQPDDAVDALQELEPKERERILLHVNRETSQELNELMEYEPDTAGGIMTPEFVAVYPYVTVGRALNALRELATEADPASIQYVYVVDAARRLMGVLPLRALVLAPSHSPVADVMLPDVVRVRADADQETAARLLRDRNLLALPVVDQDERLVGIISASDVADVLEEEATEDMYKMAGVDVSERALSPLRESIPRRLPWLGFNMAWAFAGASVINLFEGTIEQVAALAIFMPMIAGQAGNAGIQTATVVVRSMALGDVSQADVGRVLVKEWGMGFIKGIVFGTILGLIAWIWKGHLALGILAGVSLFLNIMVASTAGVLIPMTLNRVGIDPATVAGVFDTMLSDLMAFVIYLGLATIFIKYLV